MLKPTTVLESLDQDDTNIFVSSIEQKYVCRPTVLESWSLALFASWYKTDIEKFPDSDIHVDILQDLLLPPP